MNTSTTQPRRKWRQDEPVSIDLSRLFDKLPPHAFEAECALIGALILDGDMIGDVQEIITAADFYKPAHGVIFTALLTLSDAGLPIDMVHLKQKLADRHELEQVGGLDYLLTLAESVPSARAAPYYAQQVRAKALLRGAIETCATGLHSAYHDDRDPVELLDELEAKVFAIRDRASSAASESIDARTLMQQRYEALETAEAGATGLETGFYDLDAMTGGLQAGDMVVMAARPSMGKSACAMCVAQHVAVKNKQPVAIYSLEMSRDQIGDRLMSMRSEVDLGRIRRRMLGHDDFDRLNTACMEIAEAPIYVDDGDTRTLMSLRAKARRMVARHGVKLIVLDYLQLMSGSGRTSNRQEEVSQLSRGMKALARELNVPVLVLSQLNRSAESREGHRPRLSDLRESGSIEQDADVVMLLHREDYYLKQEGKEDECNGKAELILAKQRNGPTGVVTLGFVDSVARFDNLVRHDVPAWQHG